MQSSVHERKNIRGPGMTDILAQANTWQAAKCENSQSNEAYREFCQQQFYVIRRMLPELIAECERYRKIAIEERAQLNFYEDNSLDDHATWGGITEKMRDEIREQAERELDPLPEHEHVWVNMAPNIHMTCSICGKTKSGIRERR